MKYFAGLISVMMLGVASITSMFLVGNQHESSIVGEWQEVLWLYEGSEEDGNELLRERMLANLNEMIGHDFFVHENERWLFLPDGSLATTTEEHDHDRNLNWVIKGRGNVLVLKDGEKPIESYNITVLNEDTMKLYFNVDLQAKGIAELTFQRIR